MKLLVRTVTGDYFVVTGTPTDLFHHVVLEGHALWRRDESYQWSIIEDRKVYVCTASISWAEEWKED